MQELLCCHLLLMCCRSLFFPSSQKFPQLTTLEANLHWKRPHSIKHKTFLKSVAISHLKFISLAQANLYKCCVYVITEEIYVGSN